MVPSISVTSEWKNGLCDVLQCNSQKVNYVTQGEIFMPLAFEIWIISSSWIRPHCLTKWGERSVIWLRIIIRIGFKDELPSPTCMCRVTRIIGKEFQIESISLMSVTWMRISIQIILFHLFKKFIHFKVISFLHFLPVVWYTYTRFSKDR